MEVISVIALWLAVGVLVAANLFLAHRVALLEERLEWAIVDFASM